MELFFSKYLLIMKKIFQNWEANICAREKKMKNLFFHPNSFKMASNQTHASQRCFFSLRLSLYRSFSLSLLLFDIFLIKFNEALKKCCESFLKILRKTWKFNSEWEKKAFKNRKTNNKRFLFRIFIFKNFFWFLSPMPLLYE
jgi:hypothetical protein